MRRYAKLAVLGLFTIPLFAQTAASSPPAAQPATALTTSEGALEKFLAADVRVDPPAGHSGGISYFGDRVSFREVSMSGLIAYAYGVNASNIAGGPAWVDWDNYDIVALAPLGTTQYKDRQSMLQNLLAERFKLVAHPGDVPMPAYVLTVAKGKPNLKPSTSTEKGSCKSPPAAQPEPGSVRQNVLECRGVTMDSLASTLSSSFGGYGFVNGSRPVVDATGLKGAYDFDLQWTPWILLPQAGPSGISPFQALEQQLGLKLELKMVPRPGVVIDSVNEEPTPNPPDLDKIMPPLPPQEFEVATIRPAQPDGPTRRVSTNDGINYQGLSLKSLIEQAWQLNSNSDQDLVAPNWIADDRIDIQAKLPAGELINRDDFPQTLRSLLIDRFQIKYHMEDRPVDTYELVAVHPRLTRADPSERTTCGKFPGRDGKDPRIENPALSAFETCTNITMGEFAALLNRLMPGYFHDPVKDATGLKGGWNLTIAWSIASYFQNAAGPGAAQTLGSGDTPTASAPNGAVSVFDALQKLGLKAVEKKLPEPVLVIDQINRQPTEN
jgi:uncharacterized protein (TIGR03435 family)